MKFVTQKRTKQKKRPFLAADKTATKMTLKVLRGVINHKGPVTFIQIATTKANGKPYTTTLHLFLPSESTLLSLVIPCRVLPWVPSQKIYK